MADELHATAVHAVVQAALVLIFFAGIRVVLSSSSQAMIS